MRALYPIICRTAVVIAINITNQKDYIRIEGIQPQQSIIENPVTNTLTFILLITLRGKRVSQIGQEFNHKFSSNKIECCYICC